MPGNKTNDQFKLEEFEQWYELDMPFVPLSETDALNAHECIPRFGWAFDVAQELKPRKALDLGCLDGSLSLTLAHQLGCEAVGVDMNHEAISIALRRAKEHGLKATFHQSSAEYFLEKCQEKFDLITAFELLEHVKDAKRLLILIDRVLADNGTVLVSTPDFEAPTYGKDDEENKSHIRLYTTADEDYEARNIYGTLRKATSLSKQIGKSRIKEMEIINELINARFTK